MCLWKFARTHFFHFSQKSTSIIHAIYAWLLWVRFALVTIIDVLGVCVCECVWDIGARWGGLGIMRV